MSRPLRPLAIVLCGLLGACTELPHHRYGAGRARRVQGHPTVAPASSAPATAVDAPRRRDGVPGGIGLPSEPEFRRRISNVLDDCLYTTRLTRAWPRWRASALGLAEEIVRDAAVGVGGRLRATCDAIADARQAGALERALELQFSLREDARRESLLLRRRAHARFAARLGWLTLPEAMQDVEELADSPPLPLSRAAAHEILDDILVRRTEAGLGVEAGAVVDAAVEPVVRPWIVLVGTCSPRTEPLAAPRADPLD